MKRLVVIFAAFVMVPSAFAESGTAEGQPEKHVVSSSGMGSTPAPVESVEPNTDEEKTCYRRIRRAAFAKGEFPPAGRIASCEQ